MDGNLVATDPACGERWRRLPTIKPHRWLEDRRVECQTDLGVDRCGRKRSRATDPNFLKGVRPPNAGLKYFATPYTDDQVLGLMAGCPDTRAWRRMRALIALLWRSGLRISEALDLVPADLDPLAGTVTVRCGKGGKRRISALDPWAFDIVLGWLAERAVLPAGPVFCVVCGPTRGGWWSSGDVRGGLQRLKARTGFEGRLAPHQLRHSHAVGLAKEGVLLPLIQRQLGHSNVATTSTYLQGISPQDVIDAISTRPIPRLQTHRPEGTPDA
jgi:site-specific recombinase XerD